MKKSWGIISALLLALTIGSVSGSVLFLRQGKSKVVSGNLDEAIQSFHTALTLNPLSRESARQLCFTYSRLKRQSETARLCGRAISLGAKDYDTYVTAGLTHYNLGNYEEALPYIQKAKALSPDPMLIKALGDTLVTLRQYDAARDTYADLVKTSAVFPPLIFWVPFEFASLKSNNTTLTISLLNKWAESSTDKVTLSQIAKSYRRLGEIIKAQTLEAKINAL